MLRRADHGDGEHHVVAQLGDLAGAHTYVDQALGVARTIFVGRDARFLSALEDLLELAAGGSLDGPAALSALEVVLAALPDAIVRGDESGVSARVLVEAALMGIVGTLVGLPLGIGLAATVRVGLAAGARDLEGVRRAGWSAIVIGSGFMLVCAVIIALIPRSLVGIYIPAGDPANADAVKLAVSFLYVAAFFQLFDAMQVTAQLSLRGLKDATAPMWIAGLSYWLVGFALAYGLGVTAGMQGFGVWIGLAAGLAAAAFGMVWRFEILSRRTL